MILSNAISSAWRCCALPSSPRLHWRGQEDSSQADGWKICCGKGSFVYKTFGGRSVANGSCWWVTIAFWGISWSPYYYVSSQQ